MSFYGKDPEPSEEEPKIKRFRYTLDTGQSEEVLAHTVYFYESGHVGFWNDRTETEDGQLVLAIKAVSVWEEK